MSGASSGCATAAVGAPGGPQRRTFQRTVYRPGEICQLDVWEPMEIPVGHGQTPQGYVVVACLGYSRAGAGALIFTKQTPGRDPSLLWSLGALPQTLVR